MQSYNDIEIYALGNKICTFRKLHKIACLALSVGLNCHAKMQ